MATLAPWREWLAPQREKLRASPNRMAGFLIAVYFIVSFQHDLWGWLRFAGRSGELLTDWNTLEVFTWPWVRELLTLFLTHSQWGWSFLLPLIGIAPCLLATAWLFGLSWKATLAKLGLKRPKRVEFTIPMVASVPGVTLVVLLLWPSADFTTPDQTDFARLNLPSLLLIPISMLVPLGFLYRGLIQDAKWSPTRSLIVLVAVPFLVDIEFYVSYINSLSALFEMLANFALTLIYTALQAWIFHRWRYSIWSLGFLALGHELTQAFVPISTYLNNNGFHYGLYMLSLAPTLLLALWTWKNLPVEQRPTFAATGATQS